jgi:RNA 2',3'-cyclic 3'-phosphodiesterase
LKLRLFVALDLPEPARAALVAFRTAMADPAVWRPVPDEALHLTLAFLGHRPETDVERIAAVLREAPSTAPRLTLGRALGLPLKRPRALTTAIVDHNGTLRELQAWLSQELSARGLYEPEAREFRPHATVARLRPDARVAGAKMPGPAPVTFYGEAITLYRSQLRREGARYEPLARLPLREWSSRPPEESEPL